MRMRNDNGAVTAETAIALPILTVFTLTMVWFVSWGITAVRAQDAAREAARVVARGDPVPVASELARRVAPAGSAVSVQTNPRSVLVVVTARVRGPGGAFGFLPGITVHGQAEAATEADVP